jgi:hypothetical protein
VLDELAELVAARVLAKLSAPTTHYSSASKSGALPPGKSRAWALRNLQLVPGARKVGRDWVVAVADFDAWAAEKDSERLARKQTTKDRASGIRHTGDIEIERLANESLARAGMRRVE